MDRLGLRRHRGRGEQGRARGPGRRQRQHESGHHLVLRFAVSGRQGRLRLDHRRRRRAALDRLVHRQRGRTRQAAVLDLRTARERAGLGPLRHHHRLRKPVQRRGQRLLHPHLLRHLERIADRDRGGRGLVEHRQAARHHPHPEEDARTADHHRIRARRPCRIRVGPWIKRAGGSGAHAMRLRQPRRPIAQATGDPAPAAAFAANQRGSPNHRRAARAAASGSAAPSPAQATTPSGRTSKALSPSRCLASRPT